MVVNQNFAEFRNHALKNRVLSKDLFAEDVTYKIPGQSSETVTALCNHKDEVIVENGAEVVVETLTVTVARDAIACPPNRGHKIRRAGEDRDFVFIYNGRHDGAAYRVVFERRRTITERTG